MPPEGNTPSGRQTQATQAAPVPVTVAEASTRDVPIFLDGLGTVQASIRSRSAARSTASCKSVNFVEGQEVHKGDVLAVIDPRPLPGGARSGGRQEGAGRGAARLRAEGPRPLPDAGARKGFETQQSLDQQQAKVDQLKATIDADQAAIESAQTQLSYATIIAADRRPRRLPPGRRRQHHPCRRSQSAHGADADQAGHGASSRCRRSDLGPVREAMLRGPVAVLAFDQDNTHQLAPGELLLIDNQIDQATSTIRLKARFPTTTTGSGRASSCACASQVDTRDERRDRSRRPRCSAARKGLFAWVDRADDTAEQRPISKQARSTTETTIVTKRPRSRRARRRQRPISAASRARASTPSRTATSRVAQERAHEHFRTLHPPADRDLAADGGARARRHRGVSAAAGRAAAAGRFSDHPGVRRSLPGASPDTMASTVAAPLERQFGQIAGITQMTSTQHARLDLDHAAVRPQPQHRRAPRRTCRRRSPRPARQLPTDARRRRRPTARSTRRIRRS